MTISDTPPRTLLAAIDRDELKALLYGEVATADQEAALRVLAEEAGIDHALLPREATGTIGEDPRTHVPAAEQPEPQRSEPREPSQDELNDLADDIAALEADALVAAYAADVAEVLDTDMANAEATVRGWGPSPRPGILAFLLNHGSLWTRLRLVTDLAA
ncbi:hypothetical protein [Nocardiopsis baichengensis]|uniref:hypothetical protein n=1 Tax=Nocardiopsis baichengensis TaxID=280240 RepID=UPI0003661B66|nr:hypothetical protein [Nocardiopsis baichengensis]